MKLGNLLLASLLTLLVMPLAYSQAIHLTVDIPFAFTAEGKLLPAGHYEFTPETNNQVVRVQGPRKGTAVMALVITRIAGDIHTTANDAHIVFDKVGDSYTLSEIWAPGNDGFLMHVTKEKHTHHVINVPR